MMDENLPVSSSQHSRHRHHTSDDHDEQPHEHQNYQYSNNHPHPHTSLNTKTHDNSAVYITPIMAPHSEPNQYHHQKQYNPDHSNVRNSHDSSSSLSQQIRNNSEMWKQTFTSSSFYHNMILPAFFILLWFLFNVTTVVLNKYIYKEYKFNFAFSLTIVHMVVCSIGSTIILRLFPYLFGFELFKFKKLPHEIWKKRVIPLSVLFCVNIILGNISLQYVPVSFMQTIKIHATVMMVVFGVGASTLTEINFNWIGFICAALASITTALQAIIVGKILTGDNKLDSINLVYYMSPLSCLFLVPFAIILESNTIVKEWEYFGNSSANLSLLLSGLIAYGLNISSFWVVKYTSALTFNVAGNFKVVLSILISVSIFKNEITFMNLCGCGIALVGTFLYNFFRTHENFSSHGSTSRV